MASGLERSYLVLRLGNKDLLGDDYDPLATSGTGFRVEDRIVTYFQVQCERVEDLQCRVDG